MHHTHLGVSERSSFLSSPDAKAYAVSQDSCVRRAHQSFRKRGKEQGHIQLKLLKKQLIIFVSVAFVILDEGTMPICSLLCERVNR